MKGVFNMAFSIDELTKKAKDMAAAAPDKAKARRQCRGTAGD